jgi:cysteamine dioxygenase
MEAADVGIDGGEKAASSMAGDEPSPKRVRLLPAHGFTRITYVHIHQSDDFSVRLLPAISRRGLGLAAGGF